MGNNRYFIKIRKYAYQIYVQAFFFLTENAIEGHDEKYTGLCMLWCHLVSLSIQDG